MGDAGAARGALRLAAAVLRLDGVVADTAGVHAAAWKLTMDDLLRRRARRRGDRFRPFDLRDDYLEFFDGRGWRDGVQAFLASRAVRLSPEDAGAGHGPDLTALGERAEYYVRDHVGVFGITAARSSVRLLRDLHEAGLRVAAVSAQCGARSVVAAAGVARWVDLVVDGRDSDRLAWEKGDSGRVLRAEAVRRSGVPPQRAAAVECALEDVAAASADGFGRVIGVDWTRRSAAAFHTCGADVVVSDLAELGAGDFV